MAAMVLGRFWVQVGGRSSGGTGFRILWFRFRSNTRLWLAILALTDEIGIASLGSTSITSPGLLPPVHPHRLTPCSLLSPSIRHCPRRSTSSRPCPLPYPHPILPLPSTSACDLVRSCARSHASAYAQTT